jgi:hypothetical protein
MASDLVSSKAKLSGTFYLVDPETVLSLYEKAGKDPDSESEENAPDYVECIDGEHYLFTGWTVKKDGEEFEFIVKLGKNFSEAEIDSIDFMQLEEDDEDE